MKDYIIEAFTDTESGLNAELNNLTVNCLNSKNNNFNLDCEGNLFVNSIMMKTSSSTTSGLTFDDIYPIGTYYETSDESFNPNVSWQGEWILDTLGRVTVSKDESQSEFSTIGKLGGDKELQKHHHDIRFQSPEGSGVTISYTGEGLSALNVDNWSWQENLANEFHGSSNLMTNSIGTGESGNLQPYVVVNRWHRVG